jgi:cytochrome c oxidase subunit 4
MKAPSTSTYWYNCFALLALLALTIGAAHLNLGPFNAVVSMAIAAAKASLILLFFMQIRRSRPVTWLCAAAGIFWLGILIFLAMGDYISRGWR